MTAHEPVRVYRLAGEKGRLLLDDGSGLFDLSAHLERGGRSNDPVELADDGWFGAEGLEPRLPRSGAEGWAPYEGAVEGGLPARLGLPIARASVGKILALGKNFRAHAAEFGEAVPEEPLFFNKLPETLMPNGAVVTVAPWYTGRVDHEAELAVVIGLAGRDIQVEDAHEHVAGYSVANDLTARSLQGADREKRYPWFRAKNMDGFCPLGPCFVPRDYFDLESGVVTAHVGDELRQSAALTDMVVDVPHALAYLSRHLTLRPGDIVLMGTPEGVGPLADADTVRCAISGIGELHHDLEAPGSGRTMSEDAYSLSGTAIEGLVFDASISAQPVPAILTVTPEALCAAPRTGTEVTLKLETLKLERGPGGELVARAPGGKRWVSSADDALLRALETAAGNELNDQLSRLAGERVSHRGAQVLGCLAIVGLVWLLWWGVPMLFRTGLDAAVSATPKSVDESLGEAAQEAMKLEGKEVEDADLREAVQAMLDRLIPHAATYGDSAWTFRFRIIENDQVNAFALPGGYMTVFTGLIAKSDRPEQVAGVLAHEMAHVTLRHGMYRVAHSLGLMASVSILLGDLGGLESVAADLFTMSTVNGYSQEQETAADLEGVRMLIEAGIDPEALADFFRTLEDEHGDIPDALSWLSTHPQHKERVAAIRRDVEARGELPEWRPIELDRPWEDLREAAR